MHSDSMCVEISVVCETIIRSICFTYFAEYILSSVTYIFNIKLRSNDTSSEQRVVLKIKGNNVLLMSERGNACGMMIFYIIITFLKSLYCFAQPMFVK